MIQELFTTLTVFLLLVATVLAGGLGVYILIDTVRGNVHDPLFHSIASGILLVAGVALAVLTKAMASLP